MNRGPFEVQTTVYFYTKGRGRESKHRVVCIHSTFIAYFGKMLCLSWADIILKMLLKAQNSTTHFQNGFKKLVCRTNR